MSNVPMSDISIIFLLLKMQDFVSETNIKWDSLHFLLKWVS